MDASATLAGNFAATLFTIGIVGLGFLAIPTLAGSAAYAFAETLGWRQGLNKRLKQAPWFLRSYSALDGRGRRIGLRTH
jgi:Mn2+/Fe2+ NRAMP family transporter